MTRQPAILDFDGWRKETTVSYECMRYGRVEYEFSPPVEMLPNLGNTEAVPPDGVRAVFYFDGESYSSRGLPIFKYIR